MLRAIVNSQLMICARHVEQQSGALRRMSHQLLVDTAGRTVENVAGRNTAFTWSCTSNAFEQQLANLLSPIALDGNSFRLCVDTGPLNCHHSGKTHDESR